MIKDGDYVIHKPLTNEEKKLYLTGWGDFMRHSIGRISRVSDVRIRRDGFWVCNLNIDIYIYDTTCLIPIFKSNNLVETNTGEVMIMNNGILYTRDGAQREASIRNFNGEDELQITKMWTQGDRPTNNAWDTRSRILIYERK